MGKDITSANSTAVLTGLGYNIPFQGYSVDEAAVTESVKFTETRVGVDGIQVGGYVPQIKPLTFTFEASSSSIQPLLALKALADTLKAPVPVVITITYPSVGMRFVCTGFYTDAPAMPSARRLLEAMPFRFEMAEIIPMPM